MAFQHPKRWTWLLGLAALGAAGCGGGAQTAAAPPATPTPAAITIEETPPAHQGPLDDAPPDGADGRLLSEAVARMDIGELVSAIAILELLWKKRPNNGVVLHELGLAYRLVKRPADAVALWTPFRSRLSVLTLAGLASALDEAGRPDEAIAMLREEIPRHPDKAILLSELGTTLTAMGKEEEAIALYERGTQVEPAFPATYMHLARLYSSRNPALALLNGETFRVLEPNTPRSERIGKLLMQVCAGAVTLDKPGGKVRARVSLAPGPTPMQGAPGADLPLANAFEAAFGPPLVKAHVQGLTLASLHAARRELLSTLKTPGAFPALDRLPILRWLRALDAAGHLEAYDYWLFSPADEDAATSWAEAHETEVRAAAKYLNDHPLFP